MKLVSSQNLKYVAMGVIGILVILWAYRHFMKDGFQNAPSSGESIQQAMVAEGPGVLCTNLKSTVELLQRQIEKTENKEIADGLNIQLQIISKQADNACNPTPQPPVATS